jgi:rhamnulokinase
VGGALADGVPRADGAGRWDRLRRSAPAERPARLDGPHRFAAVDLGASSGRVIVVEIGRPAGAFELQEVHRFPNQPVSRDGCLRWDFEGIWANVLEGLRRAAATGPVESVGIDTWGADYGLLDAEGNLLGAPICYRDARTEGVAKGVWAKIGRRRLYELTGAQYQRFNTVFQLAAEPDERLARAAKLLMMPDLLAYRLTGRAVAEATAASTTGLFDVRRRDWCWEAIDALGLDPGLFPEVFEPGDGTGQLTPEAQAATGLGPQTLVVAVGGHDTASAVAAVPAKGADFAYISSGTWSLVGVETAAPVLSQASQEANFTNELGVFGRVCHLKNVMGLWLLSECQRTWEAEGLNLSLPELLAAAAEAPERGLIAADSGQFLAPGDMPGRIARAAAATGGEAPRSPAETVRCIIDSLAAAYAQAVKLASVLSGQAVNRIHIVGGGSLNALLCQATADSTGLPVLAGPVEASVIGNALIQAHAAGVLPGRAGPRSPARRDSGEGADRDNAARPSGFGSPSGAGGDLEALRALVAERFPLTAYTPRERARPGAPAAHAGPEPVPQFHITP